MVQYSDDQAIDTTKLSVTLDGVALAMMASPTSATTLASGLGNGAHLLVASIRDLAGNVGSAQINFNVDTTVPTIHVTQPAPNAILNTHVPPVSISYSDVSGLNLTTLKVYVNGIDATSLFTANSATATAELTTAFSLPDGQIRSPRRLAIWRERSARLPPLSWWIQRPRSSHFKHLLHEPTATPPR